MQPAGESGEKYCNEHAMEACRWETGFSDFSLNNGTRHVHVGDMCQWSGCTLEVDRIGEKGCFKHFDRICRWGRCTLEVDRIGEKGCFKHFDRICRWERCTQPITGSGEKYCLKHFEETCRTDALTVFGIWLGVTG